MENQDSILMQEYEAYLKEEQDNIFNCIRGNIYSRESGGLRVWELSKEIGISYKEIMEVWPGRNWESYRSPWFVSLSAVEIEEIKRNLGGG